MKLLEATKIVFTDTNKYAYHIKNKSKKDSWIFMLKAFLFFTILSFVVNIRNIYSRAADAETSIVLVLIAGIAVYLAIATVVTFVGASILHMFTKIFSSKEKFSDTYAIYCYGSLPYALISWIPYINLVGVAYMIYVQIVALRHGHYFNNAKAVAAYILHFIVLLVIAGLVRMII